MLPVSGKMFGPIDSYSKGKVVAGGRFATKKGPSHEKRPA
jgi:hypothetical protein